MRISVCMGTYNGAKYIEQQMYSILHQTCPPDEVVICDDGSGDSTVEIIRKFINENSLGKKWKLYVNQENLGYPGNFYHVMGLCSGEAVFLSDQDDIWSERKLEKMTEVLEKNPDAKAVCCKFGLMDASGESIHTIMAPARSRGTGKLRNVTIEDVFYKCEWPGMVVAYRGEWYRGRLAEWAKKKEKEEALFKGKAGSEADVFPVGIPHDFLVCAWAAEENGFIQIDEELAYHRLHDANTGGEEHRISRLLNRERKLEEIRTYLSLLRLFDENQVLREAAGRQALEEKRRIMESRYAALEDGRIGSVLKNAWRNRKGTRLATALCDVGITVRGKH